MRARRLHATAASSRLSIATGGTGGVFYPYGGGIAKVITEGLPNVEATAEVTAASIDNLKFLKQGTSDLAFTMSDTAQDAVLARDDFKDFGAIPLRTLAVLYSSYTHLVTLADSGITRRRAVEGTHHLNGRGRFGHSDAGLPHPGGVRSRSPDDIRSQSLGVAQSVDALKDGKIDAFFWNGGLPTASVLDLVNTPRIRARFIATDVAAAAAREDLRSVALLHGHHPEGHVSTGHRHPGRGRRGPARRLGDRCRRISRTTSPACCSRSSRELATIHPQAKVLSIKTATTGSPIPFHPGAIRYYRDQQAWTN